MSSTTFKNLIQRREHKERSQPAHRSKYGLLEKHSDYVERAKNFHGKEKRILALKRRASMRNPDEYYFGMHSTKTKNGVHTKARNTPALTDEELQLLKTQDRSYVQTIINAESKRIEKLEASLHGVSAAGRSAHGSASSHHLRFDATGDAAPTASSGAGDDDVIDGCLDAVRAGAAPPAGSSGGISGLKRRRAAEMEGGAGAPIAGPSGPSKRSRIAADEDEDEEGSEHEGGSDDDAEDSDDALSFDLEDEEEEEDGKEGDEAAGGSKAASEPGASRGAAAACRAGASATIRPAARSIRKATAALYGELQERRERLGKLQRVLATMALEAQLRSKGGHKKVQEATSSAPAVYKWKPVRSR